MRILVSGGAGFIGSNLVHYLLVKASHDLSIELDRVVTLDKLTYSGNRMNLADLSGDPRHVFVEGDICDSRLVSSLLREHQIDAIMHLAAETHVDRSINNPEEFIKTNFVGTFRLIEAFRHYLLETGRLPESLNGSSLADGCQSVFLHVSTDEVFGSLGENDPAFCESTAYSPNSPYSATKAGSDHIVRSYGHTYRMPVITTHCSNNYGPYQFPEKLLPLMISKLLNGETLPIYGNGSNIRDWLYVEDHCRALTRILLQGIFGKTYVIGGKCEMKNIDVVHTLIKVVRELVPERVTKTTNELIGFVRDRPGHDQRYAIDPTRIENELGWFPKEDFSSGLRKTVQWYLNNEDWIQMIENESCSRKN